MGQCCLAHRISCPGRFLDGHHPGRQTAVSIKESGRQLPVCRLVIPVLLRTASPPYHAPSFPSSLTPHSPPSESISGIQPSVEPPFSWFEAFFFLSIFLAWSGDTLLGRRITSLGDSVLRGAHPQMVQQYSALRQTTSYYHQQTPRCDAIGGETIWIGCDGRGGIDGWRWSDIDHLRTPILRWKSVVPTSSA